MTLLSDGLSVYANHWQLISGILLIILMCQFLVGSTLRMVFGTRLSSDEYLSLDMGGWVVLLSLASLLWFSMGLILGAGLSAVAVLTLLIFIAFTILFFKVRKEIISDAKIVVIFLFLLFGMSIILRLAFVSKTLLPLYFDSARHYLFTRNILGYLEFSPAPSTQFSDRYYHLGFHFLTGFLSSALRAEINDVILILGQIILAGLPLSVFFIVKHETRSNNAAFFAVLLSTLGWYMPAYAANWGKYPALTSLVSLQFVLSLAYLLPQYGVTLSARRRWVLYAILALGVLISGFIHTRVIAVFGVAVLAWFIAGWRQSLPRLTQSIVFWLIVLGTVWMILFIQRQDIFSLLFDPYGLKGILVTVSVLVLILPAERAYPRLAFSSVLVILFLLFCILISVPDFLSGYPNLTLLDRPFVEMILYLPLSLLGGLGLAGLKQSLGQANPRLAWLKYTTILPIVLVLINAFSQYNPYPAGCCEIVSTDDLTAMDWMDQNVPTNARILVASTEMRVLGTDTFQGYIGTDAGAWISPLTDRKTIPFMYDSDFSTPTTLNSLCKRKVTHLYVGGLDPTFDDSKISAHPNWYKAILSMSKVKIYKVVGCKPK